MVISLIELKSTDILTKPRPNTVSAMYSHCSRVEALRCLFDRRKVAHSLLDGAIDVGGRTLDTHISTWHYLDRIAVPVSRRDY
jgi:hypothetical protein